MGIGARARSSCFAVRYSHMDANAIEIAIIVSP